MFGQPFGNLAPGNIQLCHHRQKGVLPGFVASAVGVDAGEMKVVAQDGRRRLTMITCTDWIQRANAYQTRLVVVAVPM